MKKFVFKRKITLCLVFAMLLTMNIAFASEMPTGGGSGGGSSVVVTPVVLAPTITSYGFMANNEVINTVTTENKVRGYVDVESKFFLPSDNLGTLIFASYVNGKQISMVTSAVKIEGLTLIKRIVTDEIDVPAESNAVFKVFIMDNLNTIRPIMEMYKLGQENSQVNVDATTYFDDIETVKALNLVKGTNDATFLANTYITRAEFTANLLRLLGKAKLAQSINMSDKFSDVSKLHWASKYINYATYFKYINGVDGSKFAPESKITYEQAVKALVLALGYTSLGDDYILYMDKAFEIGILNGINDVSNDGLVSSGVLAKLMYNCLDTPIIINGFVQDGLNNTIRETPMSKYLSLVKLQVAVTDCSIMSSTSTEENYVNVNILNSYWSKYFVNTYGNFKFAIGATNLATLVGRKAIVYISYNSQTTGTPVAVYSKKDTSNITELTVSSNNVVSYGNMIFEYLAKPTDLKTTKITISRDCKIYLNGGPVYNYTSNTFIDFYGEITFAKMNSSTAEDYDTAYITDYTNFVVDSVNVNTKRVIPKNSAGAILFDPDDTSVRATLYDENGNKMAWENLKCGDVLSCLYYNGPRTVITANVVKNQISGKIVGVTNSNYNGPMYEINGQSYTIDYKGFNFNLILEDEGVFYLDKMGRIAWFEPNIPPKNYAYIINIDVGTGIDPRTEMKVFTDRGEILTLNTAYKVKMDDVASIPSTVITSDYPLYLGQDETYRLTSIHGTDCYNISTQYPQTITGIKRLEKGQLITYEKNTKNEISILDRAASVGALINLKGRFTRYQGMMASADYNKQAKSLSTPNGRVYLTDKTKIMVAPMGSTEEVDYEIFPIDKIVDEQAFNNVMFFDVGDDRTVSLVLVNSQVTIQEPPVIEVPTAPEKTALPVTGKITVVTDAGTPQAKYTINNVAYQIDTTLLSVTDLKYGDEYTFYINKDNKIIYYHTPVVKKYAYVMNLAPKSALSEVTEMMVYTDKGSKEILTTAPKIKLDGVSDIYSGYILSDIPRTISANDSMPLINTHGTDWYVIDATNAITGIRGVMPQTLITYETDSNNQIISIDRAKTVFGTQIQDRGSFSRLLNMGGFAEYRKEDKSLFNGMQRVYLNDNSIVMVVPPNNDDSAIFNVAAIEDGQTFDNVQFFDVDQDRYADFVLVNSYVALMQTGGFAAITKVTQKQNIDGDSILGLSVLKDGTSQTMDTTPDLYINPVIGDVVLPIKNINGTMKDLMMLAHADTQNNQIISMPFSDYKNTYYFGNVSEIKGNNVMLNNGQDFVVDSATNVYVYDERSFSTLNRVSLGDINAVDVRIATQQDVYSDNATSQGQTIYDDNAAGIANMSVFAHEYDGKIVDVMLYIFN